MIPRSKIFAFITPAARANSAAAPLAAANNNKNNNNNGRDGFKANFVKMGVASAGVLVGVAAIKAMEDGHINLPSSMKLSAKAKTKAEPKASAEEQAEKEVLHKENRIRKFGTLDQIFDFFASYRYTDSHGKNMILMSAKDFYNSVTPGSTLTHGTGRGSYTVITDEEIGSKKLFEEEAVPIQDSFLNKIQRHGLMTYVDFSFLLNILSTPRRYLDIAFHAFDVSADGNCEAKEFAHVMAKVTNYKGNPEELLEDKKSGLITYIFGRDRKRVMTRTEFKRLQRELITDVLFLEFSRYQPDKYSETITEIDFCNHLLYNSNMPPKKKAKMLKRIEKKYGKNGKGVGFPDFRNFYYVLFGGADLERAMFFLDSEKNGVTKEEFADIAKWVANRGVSEYVIEIIFTLLDEDGDAHLSIEEFHPVLFQWRHSRGFQKAALQISLGHLEI